MQTLSEDLSCCPLHYQHRLLQLSCVGYFSHSRKSFGCRSVVYDSSLGGCLQSLHSSCSDDVVRSTAADIVRIFPESMLKTRSLELKVNFAYH